MKQSKEKQESTKLKIGSLKKINNIDKTLIRLTKREDSK